MERSDITALIGRCGLYCGACDIYRAYTDQQKEKLEKMAKYFKCPVTRVRCHGCQNTGSEDWGHDCKIVQCLDRNEYRYCYECNLRERCDLFQNLNRRYNGIPMKNLGHLQKGDEEKFVRAQKRLWTCPCGTPFEYGAEICRQCGARLTGTPDS